MTTDTTVQPPIACDKKRSTIELERSGFAVDDVTINERMMARAWKRSRRSLRYPVSCSEFHPYLNPDPSIDPDRNAETTDAAATNSVPTSAHSKCKKSGKSHSKTSKKSKSKRAKSAKNQSTDAEPVQPASKISKSSKRFKTSQPSASKRRRTGKDLRRVPEHDDLLDHERDWALMDTFETLGNEMIAETYGYELASRMNPAAWDYNFF